MSQLSAGIVGLANVGKSTLFNALLKKQVAESANYPFTTIEPNVGVVEVPDERLQKLAEVIRDSIAEFTPNKKKRVFAIAQDDRSEGFQNDKGGDKSDIRGWGNGKPPIVPAVVKFVDIAGLVKGAHKGEGLGNQFLSHIREVDVIVFVLRDFSDENVVKTGENPKEDLEILKEELLLKDLETLEKRVGSLQKEVRGLGANDSKHALMALITKVKELIEKGTWVADELTDEELEKIKDLSLLSSKKTIVVVNSDEGSVKKEIGEIEESKDIKAIRISAKLEEELSQLSDEEQVEYLKELGIDESGLNRLIKLAYKTLGLSTFFTAGEKEVRAWTIKTGSLAPQAAGTIHTDFEKGFIAADIVPFQKFVDLGGWQAARSKGAVKTIGKSEVMPEDVVVEFKASV